MDRIKPEKLPRQRVQKIWRNVRWAEAFPDDSLTMDANDITPNFALRKVALLFETKKYSECATLIRRLNCVTLSNILREVPIDVLHDSLPQSLSILEALYVKLYEITEHPEDFPREEIQVDNLLLKMVAMFARQSGLNNKHEKNSNSVYPSCRSILRVITWIEPHVRRQVKTKKRTLDKCLHHLGRHGLVESSEGTLMNLHDAFKIEFEKVVGQYRGALQKLEELHMSAKHPTGSTVAWGPAPSSSSHHRMVQIKRDDVQDRIIKNRTLHNQCEPAVSNQYLKKFIHVLEKRIEYDKIVLFHDTELKKINKSETADQTKSLSVSLKEYSEGYASVLRLLKEVIEEDQLTEDDDEGDDVFSSDDDTISPLAYKERLRSLSGGGINGMFSQKYTGGGSTSRRKFRHFKGRSFTEGTRPSIIPLGQTFRHGSVNGINGHISSHFNNSLPSRIGKVLLVNEEQKLQVQEIESLKAQLQKTEEMVGHLQHQERQYLHQIAQLQYNEVELAVDRATLIDNYAKLYREDRENALQALHSILELKDVHSLKGKILFSVVVLAFRSVQQAIQELRGKVRHILKLPVSNVPMVTDDPIAMEMESHIDEYMIKTAQRFDVTPCVQEVSAQIIATLFDYPCLKTCEGLLNYIRNCVTNAWQLSVQKPPYVILYDSRIFLPDFHTTLTTDENQSTIIQNFIWPTLLHGVNGSCVFKGIVET